MFQMVIKEEGMIILTVGISGSGKSTWVRDFCFKNNTFLRSSRDDIRRVLVGGLKDYYTRKDVHHIEDVINEVELDLFDTINGKWNLVVDNTNLRLRDIQRWMKIGKGHDIKFKLFDCELATAKARVSERDGINTSYIDGQFSRYENIKKELLTNYKDNIYE